MFKEILYTGVGIATLFKERVEEELKKLEEKGKINATDAKSFLESLESKGKESEVELKSKLQNEIKRVLDEMGVATKEDLSLLKEELIKELK